MAVLTLQKTMLYCPKCRAAYEEGTQRFCAADGVRLLPEFPQAKGGAQTKAVFSNIFNRNFSPGERQKKPAMPFDKVTEKPLETVFQPPVENQILPAKSVPSEEKVTPQPKNPKPDSPAKPLPRLIRPNEITISQAKLGDRSVNPTGRVALNWENTEIMIGQTIKGRYHIVEKLSEDELSVAYLSEDKIVKGRKAVVRVLMVEKDADDYLNKIFAEERVSLSHINHPNVAHLFDSGVLPEGKIFIVTEYIEGESLKENLYHSGAFSPLQTARIIRQTANALNEVHQNGILHRNLKPQNIILGETDYGLKFLKVTDFAVYDGFEEQTQENIKYLSPEQLEGKMPTFASDIYSLAVIAYQMLTGRFPFNFSTEKELLKAQKEGLSLCPTNLRLDLSTQVDEVLEKALAYKPSDRYPKARDFGEAFYNALTLAPSWQKSEGEAQEVEEKIPVVSEEKAPIVPSVDLKKETEEPKEEKLPLEELPVIENKEPIVKENPLPAREVLTDEISNEGFSEKPEKTLFESSPLEPKKADKTPQISPEAAGEKRAPERIQKGSWKRATLIALGLILLGIGGWALWNYYLQRPAPPTAPQNTNAISEVKSIEPNQNAVAPAPETVKNEPTTPEVESPPVPRQITPPPSYVNFKNSKENLKGDLLKNFRAFSFYYPKDWAKGESATNFVDVARIAATGTPVEQMLISYYDSNGTLAADQEKFSKLVEQSSEYFSGQFPNYRLVSQGETRINGDWKAYEMKFSGEGRTKNGDYITVWGRRLWIPAARHGVKSGFVITMLATSLSPEIKSANDVGVKGELATVLQTFEPASLDAAF